MCEAALSRLYAPLLWEAVLNSESGHRKLCLSTFFAGCKVAAQRVGNPHG